MFRVCQLLIVATLPAFITGCTWGPEAQPAIRIVTKTVVKIVERENSGRVVTQCPRDEEIADGVVVTFADIYPRVPGSTRTCPCPDSTYVHLWQDAQLRVRWSHPPCCVGLLLT